MTANSHGNSRRGRPRSADRTELIEGLIENQDSLSRATAAKIRDFLRKHINLAYAEAAWAHEKHWASDLIVRRFLEAAPAIHAAAVDKGTDGVERALKKLVYELLTELAKGPRNLAPPLPPLDPETRALATPPGEIRRSTNLARARGRCARLKAQLRNLQLRVVPYPSPQETKE